MIKPKMKFDGPIGAAEPGPVFIGIRKGQVGPSFGFKIWTKSIPNQGPTFPKKPIWTRVIVSPVNPLNKPYIDSLAQQNP